MEVNTIYNEDCLKTLSKIRDNSIDLVVTSPPYNMNLRIRNGKYCSRQIVKEFSTKYNDFGDNMPIDDFYKLHLKILNELLRTSYIIFYNIQIVTGSKRAFFKIIGELSDYLKDVIVWDKNHAQPAMAKKVLNRRTELILIFDSDNAISRQFRIANFNRGTLDDIWQISRGKKITGSHGAVFPEELVKTIIKNFSNKGHLVYDPFSGTGTVAACCVQLNRKYIGSEISEEYVSLARNRILNEEIKSLC
jgi:site-specific DNA-methyltransferase (adenine-specific)